MNYFELFDLPISFKINQQDLSKQYFLLQRKYHPDFYTSSTPDEQAEVLEKSAQVNKAYKTLSDPDSRIAYVLKTKGLLEEEEKYTLPPDFLMEMMELNEDLDESGGDANGQTEKINKQIQQLHDEVEPILSSYNGGDTSTEDLLKIKQFYFKKKYLKRILDRLEGISNIAAAED